MHLEGLPSVAQGCCDVNDDPAMVLGKERRCSVRQQAAQRFAQESDGTRELGSPMGTATSAVTHHQGSTAHPASPN